MAGTEQDPALDNRATVVIGGKEIEIEASNLAESIYKRQFIMGAKPPYTGRLAQDLVTDYEQSNPSKGVIPDWDDYLHTLGAIWAMAKAAGSVKQSWERFYDRAMHSSLSLIEPQGAMDVIIYDLGPRTFFRGGPGRAKPDGASDDVEQGAAD